MVCPEGQSSTRKSLFAASAFDIVRFISPERIPGADGKMAGRRLRRTRRNWAPPFAAFLCGILAFIGYDPKGALLQEGVGALAPWMQAASWVLVVLLAYLAIRPLIEHAKRAREAYRKAGLLGAFGVVVAFAAGIEILQWWQFALLLMIVALIFYATGRLR